MPNLSEFSKFLKGKDLKEGEQIVMASKGEIKEVDFKKGQGLQKVLQLDVLHNGKKKTFTPNKSSINNLALKWGQDTDQWVNKIATVSFVKGMVAGEMKDILVLQPTDDAVDEIPF